MTRRLTILLTILLAALGLKAQTKVYPVQVTISGSGDISAELSELYGVKSTLMFTFQCLDRSETSLPVAVKVRLYPSTGHGKAIENKLQTGKKTFDIGFGQTIIEQKSELEKYFLNEYTNLSQAGYYQNGQLAEGNYILQVVCYDARTISRQISNVAKIYLHIDQFNYPTLLFPRNNTDLEQYTTKPAISFQWTYYGKTDPKIRYRFELWEVINATTVETYVKQNNPIFVDDDIFVTQKSYMPELLNLKIGQKYCWRVTAYDDDHKLPFKRGGESDVYQFQYLNPPVPVTGLANKVTGKQIKYTWNADRNHTKYYVEYYDYKRDTTISSSQQDNTVTLTAPEYDYRIKFRVRAECYNDPARVSEYTPWSEAYVQPEKKIDFECGKQFPDREIANQELKTTFFEGEIVESKNGDSRYEIIKATARPDGSLDGKFYAIMDCWSGAKILCDFWDTKINTDNIILTTRYRSEDIPGFVADPEEIKKYVHELVNNAHMAATDNKIRDTILINQKFDYLYAENGRLKAVVVDKNGEPQVTDVTPDKPYSQSLITDGQGDTLVVSKKGQVMGVKEYKFAGDDRRLLNEYHRQLDSLGEWQINFTPAKNQTYAFDQIGSGNHGIFATDEYYPKSGSYDFRYKSVECGKSDKVIVDFGSYPDRDSVIFKDKYGVKLKVVDGNILSTGVSKADTNYIYAYRGDKKIGKLFLNTYQRKIYKVVLISVNEAKLPNTTDLEKYLNKVYNQCAVSFKIETRKLQVSGIENFTHGGTKVAGSVWNASQKAVLEAFGEKYEDNTAYLFFIPKAETGGVAGYMPRYYPYGFIYPGAANRTIAHELAHGIAGLEHPFPESQVSGSTQNLMDYREGTELWHFQWDMLQDPSRKIFKWWQNEQDAESIRIDDLVEAYDTARAASKWPPEFHYVADKRIACFTPAGRPIVLPKNIKTMSFLSIFEDVPQGALTSFTTETEIYVAYYRMEENKRYFKGYVQVVGTNPKDLTTYIKYKDGSTIPDYYVDDITKGLSESDLITYGYNTLCGVNIAQVVYSAVSEADRTEIKHTSDYTGSGYCQKRLPDFAKYMGYNTEFKVKDPTNCLKTQAAIEFYNSQIEALSKSLDNGYDIKKEAVIIRIALKIEEISTSNSEMSKLFDTYHNNTEQAFGTPILWNSEQKLLVLEEFLNNLFDIQKLRKQLLECKDALVLYDLLCAFRCVHNDYMDFDIIWHNIDVLCNSSAFKYDFDDIEPNVHVKMQDAISYKIRREQYLLKFIEDVTPDYYGVLLNNIFNQQVFEKFSNHLEVESYAYFVSTLFEYWVSEYKSDLAQSLLQYYQGISSDSNPPESGTYPYTFLVWHRSLFQPGTNIAYSSYWLNGKVKINQYEGFRLFASHTIIEQLVDPYKTVIIVFETVPSFLSGQIEQGQTVAMPAFFFNWIATTQDEQDFRNGITIATTLLTLGLSVKDLIGAGANLFKAGLSRTTIWALSKSTISFGCNAYGTMMLSEDFVTWLKDKHPNIETSLTWLALGWGAYGIGSSESKLLKFRKAEQEMKNIRFAQIKKEIIGEINKTKDVKTLQAVKTFNNKTNKYGYNNLDDFVSELKTLNTELKDYKRQSENVQKIADNATYTPTVRYATIEDNLLSDLKKYEDELVEYQSKIVEPITEIRFHYNELSYAFKQGYNRLSTNEEKRYYEELKNILDQIKIDFLIEDENK